MIFPPSVEHLVLPSSSRKARSRPTSTDPSQPSYTPKKTDESHEDDSRVGFGGVTLDFGRSGGVGLEKGKKGWGWVWAGDERSDIQYTLGEEQTCLFPPTRLAETEPNQIPTRDLVEASIKYAEDLCDPYERDGLRSTISSILLSEQAGPSNTSKQPAHGDASPKIWTRALDGYFDSGVDVYRGQTLAVIQNDRARIARTLLAFPTGEVGHHLNISPFLPSIRSNITRVNARMRLRFMPTSKVVERFSTPILQVCSSPVVSSSRLDRESTALVVRLQSTTHMLNISPDHSYIPPSTFPPVTSLRAAEISYEDTEGRRHVDVALDSGAWSRALIVDEGGGVWLWWEEKERRGPRDDMEKIMNLRKVRSTVGDGRHQFFRIAFGTRPGTAVVISSTEVVLIDIDDPDHPATTLLRLQGKGRYFTSLEKTAQERGLSYTTLCTTHEVIWLDESRPNAAPLSWRHDFGAGTQRDLEVVTMPGAGSKDMCTLLYSPSEATVMAFHSTKLSPVRSLCPPYAFALPNKEQTSMLPICLPSSRSVTSIVSIATDGALWSSSLLSPKNRAEPRFNKHGQPRIVDLKAVWDDVVEGLAAVPRGKVGTGERWEEKAMMKNKEMNFRWAWLEINQATRGAQEKGEADWFAPGEFERYLRELDAPMEHLMTAADLARDSIYSGPSKIHSHLLAPLPIHSQAVEATLRSLDGVDIARHLPIAVDLRGSIPAYMEARPPLFPTNDGAPPPTIGMFDQVREYFPAPSEGRSRSRLDAAQLALDLALSRLVLTSDDLAVIRRQETQSTLPIQDETEPDDLFAQAAGQLSLKEKEPPKITCHFLTSRKPDTDMEVADDVVGAEEEEGLQNLTARGLMNDWKLGEDPKNWDWVTWRKDEEPISEHVSNRTENRRIIKPLPSPRHPQTQTRSQGQQQNIHSITIGSSINRPIPPSLAVAASRSQSSLPTLQTTLTPATRRGLMQRSSPPQSALPMNGGWEEEGKVGWANTQVERGVFGGREKKGKKVGGGKKRVGGF
ncbi:hypothetical protein IAR55_006432 [Kwoniella newhampshirensis]|uniref:RNA polymerase I-specific transcription initiation factor RRN6-like protein n=1 Tax=Kwoniella newhampshirensis TaxID=1651941 RepID=A0AAW0YF74_9TREE